MIVQPVPPDQLAVERLSTNGPLHWRAIWAGVRDVRFSLAMVRQTREPFRLGQSRIPLVLYVGDDMRQALGPGGFNQRSLRRVIRTCEAAVVVSCEPLPVFYETAAATAADGRNVVLIETRATQEIPWIEFLRECRPGIGLLLGSVSEGAA